MQLEREVRYEPPSAWEVADYAATVTSELAQLAERAGLDALAKSLAESESAARSVLAALQTGKAAPDDAA